MYTSSPMQLFSHQHSTQRYVIKALKCKPRPCLGCPIADFWYIRVLTATKYIITAAVTTTLDLEGSHQQLFYKHFAGDAIMMQIYNQLLLSIHQATVSPDKIDLACHGPSQWTQMRSNHQWLYMYSIHLMYSYWLADHCASKSCVYTIVSLEYHDSTFKIMWWCNYVFAMCMAYKGKCTYVIVVQFSLCSLVC